MDLRLAGKRALITGGTSGIGAAIARALAAEGVRLLLNYVVHEDDAKAFCGELTGQGIDAALAFADIGDAAQVAAMFAAVDQRWGGIDILVNNAGIDGKRATVWESDPADWTKVIDTNLKGAYLCAREALARMTRDKQGVILNISSVHEVIAWAGYGAYAASKAGVSILAKTWAQEAAEHNVRVLSLAPGAVKTRINADVWQDPKAEADLRSKTLLNRVGAPEEIAAIAAVLVSDAASYMTATTVFVDGGMIDYPSFQHGG